jgi:hypothetical protein
VRDLISASHTLPVLIAATVICLGQDTAELSSIGAAEFGFQQNTQTTKSCSLVATASLVATRESSADRLSDDDADAGSYLEDRTASPADPNNRTVSALAHTREGHTTHYLADRPRRHTYGPEP